jgi:hypothetical protein
MSEQNVDKYTYDVVSISRKNAKSTNYVQDALQIESARTNGVSQFVKVFADVFLKKEARSGSYF